MAAMLARFLFVRWAFLLLASSTSVGCSVFREYDERDYEDDACTASKHRGGGVSPGVLNLRTGYRNG